MSDEYKDLIKNLAAEMEKAASKAEKAGEVGYKSIEGSHPYQQGCQTKRKDLRKKMKVLERKIERGHNDFLEEYSRIKEQFLKTDEVKEYYDAAKHMEELLEDLIIEIEQGKITPNQINKLEAELTKKFEDELKELRLVYGKAGLSSAFLLRRVMEKALFYSFARNGMKDEIEENGRTTGLKKMLNLAGAKTTAQGETLLNPTTAEKARDDLKFLGDTAAHNFHSSVTPEEIDSKFSLILRVVRELPITRG